MSHWVAEYIGLPWRAYASGPEAFDCHGLLWHCLRQHYGVDMSRYKNVITGDHRGIHDAIGNEQRGGDWVRLDAPCDGAVVLIGNLRCWHHIGLWVDVNGGRCLHSRQEAGVALDRLAQLHTLAPRVEFWMHRSLLMEERE